MSNCLTTPSVVDRSDSDVEFKCFEVILKSWPDANHAGSWNRLRTVAGVTGPALIVRQQWCCRPPWRYRGTFGPRIERVPGPAPGRVLATAVLYFGPIINNIVFVRCDKTSCRGERRYPTRTSFSKTAVCHIVRRASFVGETCPGSSSPVSRWRWMRDSPGRSKSRGVLKRTTAVPPPPIPAAIKYNPQLSRRPQ